MTEPGEELLEKEYKLVRIPENRAVYADIIYYDLDKSFIRKDATAIMDQVHRLMDKYSFLQLKVSSHTDVRASHAYNEHLSESRALAVRRNINDDSRIIVDR
jgi:outer membrane protein OmpA-like peptidoglycan-associated protein